MRFDDERERHLAAAQGLLPLLREFFPRATLRLRLDAGFQGDELLAYGEREGLECVASLSISRDEFPANGATRSCQEAYLVLVTKPLNSGPISISCCTLSGIDTISH